MKKSLKDRLIGSKEAQLKTAIGVITAVSALYGLWYEPFSEEQIKLYTAVTASVLGIIGLLSK